MSNRLPPYSSHAALHSGLQGTANAAMIKAQEALARYSQAQVAQAPNVPAPPPPVRAPVMSAPIIPVQTLAVQMTQAPAMRMQQAASSSNSAPSQPSSSTTTSKNGSTADEDDDQLEVREVNSIFTPYKAQVFGFDHPTALVVTSTFAFAAPKIDEEYLHPLVRHNTEISSAQLTAICMASMASAKGLGFFVGDGTGVGKGRILAGCMYNHFSFHPEADKYIFVTASNQLLEDFKRDLKNIGVKQTGAKSLPIRSISDWTSEESINMSKGILFVTYKMLARAATVAKSGKNKDKKQQSRLEQIIKWANAGGKKFNGLIALDEVHFAKEAKTATSKAVVRLQDELKDAAVVYASATAMSSVAHLCALTRLGLYGPGTPYDSFKAFSEKWMNQTRSGLEIVAAELVSRGLYIARKLSFEGTTFELAYVNLTDEQKELHKRLCKWWADLSIMENVLVGIHNRAKLWGDHLRFFKALLIAFRVDHLVQLTASKIDQGHSVVISLISTGEASAKRAIEDEAQESIVEEDGLVALKDTMRSIIKKAKDDLEDTSRLSRLEELEEEIGTFDLPHSPLDYMIHRLSCLTDASGKKERVIELTGRSGGFYMNSDRKWEYRTRKLSNIDGCKQFQSGKARIAIISSAASTGISLQNEIGGPNRRRTQIVMELPWAADQAVQALGRTNRSNQIDFPEYIVLATDLGPEKRFASTVAKRTKDLGAATQGDRRGVGSDDAFGSDLLMGTYSSEAMSRLCHAVRMQSWPKWCQHKRNPQTGDTDEDWDEFINPVRDTIKLMGIHADSPPKQLLGRLLGVEYIASNNCMRLYEAACMEAMMNAKRAQSDKSDIGVEDICLGDKSNIIDTSDGGIIQVATDIGVSFDDALKKATNEADNKKFLFCTRVDQHTNRRFTVLAQEVKAHVSITRPNGRVSSMHYTDFKDMYKAIKKNKDGEDEYSTARKFWQEEFDMTLDTCGHGGGCKFGPTCTFGKRRVNTSLVKLPGSLNALHNYSGSRQIIRLTSNDESQSNCVAVRIANTKLFNSEAIEEELVMEKKRKELTDKNAEDVKKGLVEKSDAYSASMNAASSASTSKAGKSKIVESSDDDLSDSSDMEEDMSLTSPSLAGSRRRRNSDSSSNKKPRVSISLLDSDDDMEEDSDESDKSDKSDTSDEESEESEDEESEESEESEDPEEDSDED